MLANILRIPSSTIRMNLRSVTYLHCSVAGAHHACTSSVHLCQIVESQDVARLGGQVEEFERLFVIALHTNAI